MPKAETHRGVTYPHKFNFLEAASKRVHDLYEEEEDLRLKQRRKKGRPHVAQSMWEEFFAQYPSYEKQGRDLQKAFSTADFYLNHIPEGSLILSASFAYLSDIRSMEAQYLLRDILLARCFPSFNEAEVDSHYEQSKPLINKIAALARDISRINAEGDTHASSRIHYLLSHTSPMNREVRQIHHELTGYMHSPFYHWTLRATDVVGAALTGSLRVTEAQRPLYVVKSSVEYAHEMSGTSRNR